MPSGDVFLFSGSAAMFILVVNGVPGHGSSLNGRRVASLLSEL